MPTFSRQDLDPTHFNLTITIPKEEIKPKVDSDLKRFKQRAAIKGFRPGHAPAHYVKSLYGSSIFYDAFTKLVSDHLYGYLSDNNLMVLGQPLPLENQQKYSFNIDQPESEYSITYEVGHVPEFELQGLDKAQQYDLLEISDLGSLAERDFVSLREKVGTPNSVDGDIQTKDILKVKSTELEDGSAKEGGWETTITIFVDSIADADLKQLVLGLKKGDTFRFNVNQIEDGRNGTFIRRYILNLPEDDSREVGDEFEGIIEDVSRLTPAEITPEFLATNFGEGVTTEAEALKEIEKATALYYRSRAEALVMRQIQDRLIDLNQFALPEAFLKRWLVMDGTFAPGTEEDRFPSFAVSLRWSILRDRLVKMFDVTVSKEEIEREFLSTLNGYFRGQFPPEMMMGFVDRMMKDKKEVERVTNTIEYEKIFRAALDLVTLNPKTVTSTEFHSIFDAAREEVEAENAATAQ
jgi:trigger factor